jgi:N-carbamoyl-L-amino-acid hydrolase
VLKTLDAVSRATAAKRQVSIQSELLNADAPAESGSEVVVALSQACTTHGLAYKLMTSRAYHDSLFISRIAPVAMLFIPCHNGYSHRPDEYASPEDIARGTLVLAEALARLAS